MGDQSEHDIGHWKGGDLNPECDERKKINSKISKMDSVKRLWESEHNDSRD